MANDQALINTTEDDMQEIQNMFKRIYELLAQASNNTNTMVNRTPIQIEIDALLEEIDSTITHVEFNDMGLLAERFDKKQTPRRCRWCGF